MKEAIALLLFSALMGLGCETKDRVEPAEPAGAAKAEPSAPVEREDVPSAPAVVRGKGYELTVPDGFAIAEGVEELQPLLAGGGVALIRTGHSAGKFTGSIAVTLAGDDIGGDASDPEFCKKNGADTAKATGTELLRTEIVELPSGKTCQFESRGKHGAKTQQATFTLMKAGPLYFGVTCNYDPADAKAQDGCRAALKSWKVTAN